MKPSTGDLSLTETQAIDGSTFNAFQSGDENAFETIVRLLEARLLAYLYPWLGRRELAEEVAQDAFLLLYRNRAKIHSADQLLPWLFVTSKRLAIRLAAKEGRSQYTVSREQLMRIADGYRGQASRVHLQEITTALATALSSLNPEEREIISLRFFSALKIAEIAEIMQIPIGTVGVKMGRTLEKLRRKLIELGISPELLG